MAAPIRKVAPNGWGLSGLAANLEQAAKVVADETGGQIHDTLSAFGAVVSSTAPGSLHRASSARRNIRRISGLR